MITTTEQYNSYLHLIYNANPPTFAALPTANNIYNIDLKTREITAPSILAVEKDNVSETIYFIVDRYAGYMDLANTSCVITYTTALGNTRPYFVPFYDIYSYASVNKMIIPWCLDIGVAEAAGTVEFAISFFKVGETKNEETNSMEKVIQYSLNTKPATSIVLQGIQIQKMGGNYALAANEYEQLTARIKELEGYWRKEFFPPVWTILD